MFEGGSAEVVKAVQIPLGGGVPKIQRILVGWFYKILINDRYCNHYDCHPVGI